MPTLTYLEAIRQGIWEEMERDPSVFCLGEDIGIYGGAFKVTYGFIGRFGRAYAFAPRGRVPVHGFPWVRVPSDCEHGGEDRFRFPFNSH